jgi:tRNA pseudouridine38-40 synthase
MTGTLVEVGVGPLERRRCEGGAGGKDRKACGPVAPSDGLYLTDVGY